MTSASTVEDLKKIIDQKDEMIAGNNLWSISLEADINLRRFYPAIKAKTKDYVTKMKEEHAEHIANLTAQAERRESTLLQVWILWAWISLSLLEFGCAKELESGRKAIQGLNDIKPFVSDLKVWMRR